MRFLYIKSENKMDIYAQIVYEIFSPLLNSLEYEVFENEMILYFDNPYGIFIQEIVFSMLNDFYGEMIVYESAYFKNRDKIKEILDDVKKEINKYDNKYPYINNQIIILNNIKNINKVLKYIALVDYFKDKEMLNLLKTYIENNQNAIETSKILFIHRNTLNQRIEKFYHKTGFNVREFKDAFLLYTLLIN